MRGDPLALPGPGLDVPVDIDADGVSTFGDRYVFNYWLGLGGSLEAALSAAVVTGSGIIDLSAFFSSPSALISPAPAAQPASPAAQGGNAQGGGASVCPTSGQIVCPFGVSTIPPVSLFSTCKSEFLRPTGLAVDPEQRVWISRGSPMGNRAEEGVATIKLAQTPPGMFDGSLPVTNQVNNSTGINAMDIAVWTGAVPSLQNCNDPMAYHALTTWPDTNRICSTLFEKSEVFCHVCVAVQPVDEQNPQPQEIHDPSGVDVIAPGPDVVFNSVTLKTDDVIFADTNSSTGAARIRVARPPHTCAEIKTVTTLIEPGLAVAKIWGVAAWRHTVNSVDKIDIYFVSERPSSSNDRDVRVALQDGTSELITALPSPSQARSIEIDPETGIPYVSEDASPGRIWKIVGVPGQQQVPPPVDFGTGFNKPNGLTFYPTGVMLVAEETDASTGNILVVGGWRNKFKRGDANGDGVVDGADAVTVINYTNQMGPVPQCLDAADSDDDSKVTPGDGNMILEWKFSGGPPPAAPGPFVCGRDPSPDILDCITSAGCAIQEPCP